MPTLRVRRLFLQLCSSWRLPSPGDWFNSRSIRMPVRGRRFFTGLALMRKPFSRKYCGDRSHNRCTWSASDLRRRHCAASHRSARIPILDPKVCGRSRHPLRSRYLNCSPAPESNRGAMVWPAIVARPFCISWFVRAVVSRRGAECVSPALQRWVEVARSS